jgi:hypothetical protein
MIQELFGQTLRYRNLYEALGTLSTCHRSSKNVAG